ncbi:alpha/beta hydrolase [Rugosimonospora acidiphila]|uniref:Alpha/beta hydrolase n=1 Tax=Rugosimonospora acidiphila TaxID=556531 RepID=A0ABP9SN16_9ACTN
MPNFPSLVLVHGSWHGPWMWEPLIDALPGVDVHALALPATGEDPATLGDLYDDAATVAAAIAAIDGPVVVLGHSSGGIPVTEAATADNVRRLIYLAAFQLDTGESLFSSVGSTPAPWWRVHEREGLRSKGYVVPLRPEEIFFNDCDPQDAKRHASRLTLQSWAAKTQPLTRAAWRSIPSTYVVCEADNAIPVFGQEAMAQRADKVVRLNAGHDSFLSKPAEVAALIREELSALV